MRIGLATSGSEWSKIKGQWFTMPISILVILILVLQTLGIHAHTHTHTLMQQLGRFIGSEGRKIARPAINPSELAMQNFSATAVGTEIPQQPGAATGIRVLKCGVSSRGGWEGS